MLLTRIITSFAREWRKMAVFFQFKVSLQNWHTSYYWPRQGKSKGSTFQTFFSISDAVPHFLNGPYEIPKQLAVEKNLESKSIHERRGKFLKKLWGCVGGKYNEIIGFHQLG